jgi:hypothetical protein
MNDYRMIIYAPLKSGVVRDIPLLPGQDIVDITPEGNDAKIVIDLGEETRPTASQLKCMSDAGVQKIYVVQVSKPNGAPSAVFGFLLMLAAAGLAAFLMPAAVPWIIGAFAVVQFVQWLREP